MLSERGIGKVHAATLQKMEKGTSPGVNGVWGKLWEIYGLPLRDLYEGLGLPVPTELPVGTVASIVAEVQQLPWQGQEMVLAFARQTPVYMGLAGMDRKLEAKSEPSPEEQERASLLQTYNMYLNQKSTQQLREDVSGLGQAGTPATEAKHRRSPQPVPAIPSAAGV
jgi:hypothetical protein